MTYETIITVLRANHFYPSKEIEVGTKGEKVIGLRIDCPGKILIDEKKARLEEILKENTIKATVHANRTHGYLSILKK